MPEPEIRRVEELTVLVRELARGRCEAATALLSHLLHELKTIGRGIPAAQAASGVTFEVLDLYLALEELGSVDERQARVVELRYFGELEETDVAELLGVSRTTVQREWWMARAWLGTRLRGGTES